VLTGEYKKKTTVFTDCTSKFRHVNGKNSLSISANYNVDIAMFS
jgi:hypothetical protein